MNFLEAIREAQKEAFKRQIRANTILINKSFAATNQFAIAVTSKFSGIPPTIPTVGIVKPMIMGMEVEVTDEIPDEYAFAITEVDEAQLMTEQEKAIRQDERRKVAEKFAKEVREYLNRQRCYMCEFWGTLYGQIDVIVNTLSEREDGE